MNRPDDLAPTKVYLRCEACGEIARPLPEGRLPDGWTDLGTAPDSNAGRVACSPVCAEVVAAS